MKARVPMRFNRRKQPHLSLVVNTHNAEAKLQKTLDSCAGIDEVVVGDMGSTDATLSIVKSAGGRVLSLPPAGYCEPGRQATIDAARGEWVLVLDADEVLVGGLEAVRTACSQAPSGVSAYRLPRPTLLGGTLLRGTGWGLEYERHPRLFRRREVTWPPAIHSVPIFEGQISELPPGSPVQLLHACFDDVSHAFTKMHSYSTVEAQDLVRQGTPGDWRAGLLQGVAEFGRRYEPRIDGNASLSLSFGMFWYQLSKQLRALDLREESHDSLPSAAVLDRAWAAFLRELDLSTSALLADSADGSEFSRAVAQLREWEPELEARRLALEQADIREGQARTQLAAYERTIQALQERLDRDAV